MWSFNPPVPFVISGMFTLDVSHGSPRYIFPSGYWDVADGSGREVQIGSADVTCAMQYFPDTRTLKMAIHLGPNFYDVSIEVPNSGTGGDGDGPGGSSCLTEFITIQIDGEDWWSGNAQVCT